MFFLKSSLHIVFYSPNGFSPILLVFFKAYKMPFLPYARHSGSAAPRTVVKHRVALVGVGQHEVAQQVNGLLGGVKCVLVFPITAHVND